MARRKIRKTNLQKGVLPAQQSFSNGELAVLGGCLPQTLSMWRRARLIPRVPFAGRKTRYGRESARRVVAIARVGVQAAKHPRFDEMIPIILDEAPRPGLAGVVAPAPPPTTPAPAPTATAAPSSSTTIAPSAEPDAPFTGAAWQRIELAPGIEIHLADFVPPIMRAVVREVAKRFGRTL